MVLEEENKTMITKSFYSKILFLGVASIFMTMCTPPELSDADSDAAEQAMLDSIREVRCPRIFSSAAEFYKNRDFSILRVPTVCPGCAFCVHILYGA